MCCNDLVLVAQLWSFFICRAVHWMWLFLDPLKRSTSAKAPVIVVAAAQEPEKGCTPAWWYGHNHDHDPYNKLDKINALIQTQRRIKNAAIKTSNLETITRHTKYPLIITHRSRENVGYKIDIFKMCTFTRKQQYSSYFVSLISKK